MRHALIPTICQQCTEQLHALVESGESVDYYFCDHHSTLALVKTHDNIITRWKLLGQRTRDQAEATIFAISSTTTIRSDLIDAVNAEIQAQAAIARAQAH